MCSTISTKQVGFKGNKKFVNDYTVSDIQPTIKLSLHPMTRLFDIPIDTVRGLVRFLAMAELDFWEKAA